MEEDFVIVGTRKDFGWVRQTAFKTIACGKINIQLPCGIEGVTHGETYAWFESVRNFIMGSTCDGRQPACPDNDGVLL